ncbi:MAG: hypothetical protein KDA66_11930 [Planctomycetaceae bacterium]|nr:hypothetical protein [Planctomycetaceae bacterium]
MGKLGETAAKQTKAISDLIQLIKDILMDGRQGLKRDFGVKARENGAGVGFEFVSPQSGE